MKDKGRKGESDDRQRLYGVFKGKWSKEPTVGTNRPKTEAGMLIRDMTLVIERDWDFMKESPYSPGH
jgi:hypothetical protein